MSSSKFKLDADSVELKRVKCSASATMEWTIPDFISFVESRPHDWALRLKSSPTFSLRCGQIERNFELQICYSRGNGGVGFYLKSLNPIDMDVLFCLKAIDKSGNDFGNDIMAMSKLTPNKMMGHKIFVLIKDLKEKAVDRLPNGCLKLGCDLTITDTEVFAKNYKGNRLREDLEHLQKNELLTDFKVVCKGQVFPCHKAILAARSEVFKAMFSKENAIENTKNEVEVKDFEPNIVANFIKFLYSDELIDQALYISLDLLLLADKYNVVGLRKECEKALAISISTSNAISYLCTASRIDAPLLVKRSAKFIFKNLDELVGSAEWREMVKSNPEAMNHIFINRCP